MLKKAEEEGHKAKRMFAYAVAAEQAHAKLYTLAIEALKTGKDLDIKEFYLCPVCGYIEFGAAPEKMSGVRDSEKQVYQGLDGRRTAAA